MKEKKRFLRSVRLKDDRGTTPIEFSLLAGPFLLMIVGIIELSLLYVNGAILEGATQDAARMIRTGQVQAIPDADEAETVFRDTLCEHTSLFMDCDDIQYDVDVLASFSDADAGIDLDEDGNLEGDDEDNFETGGSDDIVLIQVMFYYPLMTPLIGQFFSDSPDNTRLITSTVVLQTEPYDFEDDFGG